MDSGVIKELSIKISSHLNPPEPKGVHPLLIQVKTKMDSMMKKLQEGPGIGK